MRLAITALVVVIMVGWGLSMVPMNTQAAYPGANRLFLPVLMRAPLPPTPTWTPTRTATPTRTPTVVTPSATPTRTATPIPTPTTGGGGGTGHLEWVALLDLDDLNYQTIVGRANYQAWYLEYGVGCLSLWRYEGKPILIYSPGLFAGVGSKIMLPDIGQECRIWYSEFLGYL